MKKFHVGSILLGIGLLILLIWKIGVDALWRDLSLLGWGLVPFVLIEGIAGLFYTLGWRFCLSPSHQLLRPQEFGFWGPGLTSWPLPSLSE